MISQDEVRAAGGGHLIDRLATATTPEEIGEIMLAIKELMPRKKPADAPAGQTGGEVMPQGRQDGVIAPMVGDGARARRLTSAMRSAPAYGRKKIPLRAALAEARYRDWQEAKDRALPGKGKE